MDAGVKVNEMAEPIAMEVLARSNCTTKNCVFEMHAMPECGRQRWQLCARERVGERESESEREGDGDGDREVACKMKG